VQRLFQVNDVESCIDGCIKFLERNAKEIGLEFKSFDVKPGKPVAILTLRGRNDALPTLLLSSHMDVVPAYSQHWKYDPFSAHKDADGNIYARGTQDMKSVGIQYLEAIRRLKKSGKAEFLRTINLLFTPGKGPSILYSACKHICRTQAKNIWLFRSLQMC
jgi:aminoacylase